MRNHWLKTKSEKKWKRHGYFIATEDDIFPPWNVEAYNGVDLDDLIEEVNHDEYTYQLAFLHTDGEWYHLLGFGSGKTCYEEAVKWYNKEEKPTRLIRHKKKEGEDMYAKHHVDEGEVLMEKGTYPEIYGFKTPEWHKERFTDGDPERVSPEQHN